jgi:hypothetical protein
LSQDEITPIQPEVEDKLVVVNVNYQTLSCLENGREVYFCRVSTGQKSEQQLNREGYACSVAHHLAKDDLRSHDRRDDRWRL